MSEQNLYLVQDEWLRTYVVASSKAVAEDAWRRRLMEVEGLEESDVAGLSPAHTALVARADELILPAGEPASVPVSQAQLAEAASKALEGAADEYSQDGAVPCDYLRKLVARIRKEAGIDPAGSKP